MAHLSSFSSQANTKTSQAYNTTTNQTFFNQQHLKSTWVQLVELAIAAPARAVLADANAPNAVYVLRALDLFSTKLTCDSTR